MHETVIQDKEIFLPGETETYLKFNIDCIHTINDELISGESAKKGKSKFVRLNDFLSDTDSCNIEDCESLNFSSDIGYNIANIKLPLYGMIDYYIRKLTSLYNRNLANGILHDDDVDIYYNIKNAEYCQNTITQVNTDKLLRSIESFGPVVIQSLMDLTDLLTQNMASDYNIQIIFQIVFFVLGIFIFPLVTRNLLSNIIKDKKKEIIELIEMIFVVPLSTINIIPKYRRFIETGKLDDE